MNDSIKSILDLIDAQMTDAEFQRSVSNTKLLSDCKKKGFPEATKSGLIKFPEKSAQPRIYRHLKGKEREEALRIVTEINKLRNEGANIQEACRGFGINYQKYYDWCKALDVDYQRRDPSTLQTGHTQDEAKELIIRANKLRAQGKTLVQACKIENISISTYNNWSAKFKIKYTK
jgi:transposase-like protein